MISIVTAYYNRKKLFKRTLLGIKNYASGVDFEFIVIDDGSDEAERLEDLLDEFPFLKIIRIEKEYKWYRNPCIPFNIGISECSGDKIILQNPECYHLDNILNYVDENLTDNQYLSFGCYSLDKENTDDDSLFYNVPHIRNIIKENHYIVKIDGGLGWYNHSEQRPLALHFCTAIMAKDLVDLGGFDPRYALGYGYDDDELIFRIRQKNMKIIFKDDLLVLHQNHYVNTNQDVKYINPDAIKNKFIYDTITLNTNCYRANYIETKKYKQEKIVIGIKNNVKKVIKKILNVKK